MVPTVLSFVVLPASCAADKIMDLNEKSYIDRMNERDRRHREQMHKIRISAEAERERRHEEERMRREQEHERYLAEMRRVEEQRRLMQREHDTRMERIREQAERERKQDEERARLRRQEKMTMYTQMFSMAAYWFGYSNTTQHNDEQPQVEQTVIIEELNDETPSTRENLLAITD